MTTLRVWLVRLKGSVFPARRDAELELELRHHLEMAADTGAREDSRDGARNAALRLGGLTQSMEALRDQRGLPWLEDLVRDLVYGARSLRRSGTFTVVAVLTLALGIGAATTISSVVNTILLQPLPYKDADRLVRVIENMPTSRGGVVEGGLNVQQFEELRQRATTLDDMLAASGPSQQTIRRASEIARVWAGSASTNAFTMLGIRAAMGRTFDSGDATNSSVTVISFDAWQRIFHGDASIVGSSIELQPADTMFAATPGQGSRSLTIVGVLPRGVELPTVSADLYRPLVAGNARLQVRMIGRLGHAVSIDAAREEANAIGPIIKPPPPTAITPLRVARFDVQDLKGKAVNPLRQALRVLLAAVAVVLLIVAANIANLLLARGSAQRREMAARLALGASRSRLIRQVLAECLLLAAGGGAMGVLASFGGITLVKRLATLDAPGIFKIVWGESILPRGNEVGIDGWMFAIAFILAVVTSAVFGILPAFQVSRTAPLEAWSTRGVKVTGQQARVRTLLVFAQMALATVLLIGAGLLTHSFIRLLSVDNGFDPNHVLAFQLVFPGDYPLARKADAVADVLARLRAAPDVTAAGMTRAGILLPEEILVGTFVPPSRTAAEMRADPATRPRVRPVSSGYLTALGVPLLDGREFTPDDRAGTPVVIVLSQQVANHFFGARRAVGETVSWETDSGIATPAQVIGVVADVHNESPDRDAAPDVFVEYRQLLALTEAWGQSVPVRQQAALGFLSMAVRTRGNPAAIGSHVVASVRSVDPSIGVDAMIPMTRLAASTVARHRFYAILLSVFAGVAAILAAIGVYGVLAYDVIQRTNEIGVRMALGAQRSRVLALVLRKGVVLAAAGIVAGVGVAAATTRIMQELLFGIAPLDRQTFLLVSLLFGTVAVFASYIPARRATKVDPMVALRSD